MDAKRHHFVPQFLLRGFSSDLNKRRISLYDLERDRFIHNASIKDQAQRSKLYGSQEVESIFAQIDSWGASSIRRMLCEYRAPIRYSHEHGRLLIYLMTQAKRTPAAAARYLTDMSRTLTGYSTLVRPNNSDDGPIIIDHPNAEVWLAAKFMSMYPLGTDLRIKLLCSPVCNLFVSDNPSVFLNLMSHRHTALNPGNGIASSALVILLPVDASHCLLLYDENAYTVGGKKHSKFVVSITAQQAEELNEVQYASCRRFLYFSGTAIQQRRIKDLTRSIDKAKSYAEAHLYTHPQTYKIGGKQYNYVEARAGRIFPSAKLSFMKLNPNYKLPTYENPQYTGLRDLRQVLFHRWLETQPEPECTYADSSKFAEWLTKKGIEFQSLISRRTY